MGGKKAFGTAGNVSNWSLGRTAWKKRGGQPHSAGGASRERESWFALRQMLVFCCPLRFSLLDFFLFLSPPSQNGICFFPRVFFVIGPERYIITAPGNMFHAGRQSSPLRATDNSADRKWLPCEDIFLLLERDDHFFFFHIENLFSFLSFRLLFKLSCVPV